MLFSRRSPQLADLTAADAAREGKPAHPFDCFCVRTLESVGRHCPSFAALMCGVMAVFFVGVLAAICWVIEGKI
ncbi:MAG: hypothetical protein RLY93_17590 [Sumerlaeia bacterium]